MRKQYKHAPISEVVLGVGYRQPKIWVDLVLKNAMLCEEFPSVEIGPPLTIEILEGFGVVAAQNQLGGPFLVRRRTADNKWLVQIQANMLYLNWIRQDTDPVGNYVGFDAVKERFFSVLSKLENSLGISLREDIIFCELSYIDRFPWECEVQELSELNKLVRISTPPKFSEHGYNNVFSRFTFHDFEIQGFGLVNVNTTTAISGEQMVIAEANLRGNPAGELDGWLERAHAKQHVIFEGLFTDEMRKRWE